MRTRTPGRGIDAAVLLLRACPPYIIHIRRPIMTFLNAEQCRRKRCAPYRFVVRANYPVASQDCELIGRRVVSYQVSMNPSALKVRSRNGLGEKPISEVFIASNRLCSEIIPMLPPMPPSSQSIEKAMRAWNRENSATPPSQTNGQSSYHGLQNAGIVS
jgi:hypothetical protein